MRRLLALFVGALVALGGLFLAAGGAYLDVLGGSWDFVLMGIALLASGVLIWKHKPAGALLYAAAFAATIVWALWDAAMWHG